MNSTRHAHMNLRHTHRIFVPAALSQGTIVTPSEDQMHHLIHVLRMEDGAVLRIFNGKNGEFKGTVAHTGKKNIAITLHERLRPQQPEPDLWLCPAPIKKSHFDFMIEKATELGASEIQPLLTGRTQIREINGNRIHSMCREAAEQSERLSIPAIGNPVSLEDLIDVFPHDRAMIVCAELGQAKPIGDVLASDALGAFSKGAVITGPEGGFLPEELELLRKHPAAFFVRLGPRILRADTAAIAALTCWQALKGDWALPDDNN